MWSEQLNVILTLLEKRKLGSEMITPSVKLPHEQEELSSMISSHTLDLESGVTHWSPQCWGGRGRGITGTQQDGKLQASGRLSQKSRWGTTATGEGHARWVSGLYTCA